MKSPFHTPANATRGPRGACSNVSPTGAEVLTYPQGEARLLNHAFIGSEHILPEVLLEADGVGTQVLRSLGIFPQTLRQMSRRRSEWLRPPPSGSTPVTPRAKPPLRSR